MVTGRKLQLLLLLGLLLVHRGASQCVTEDGIVEPGEECDGGMDCTMCGLDVIVELSLSDPNTNNYSLDYFDLDQVVFLANTTDTFIRVSRIRSWTSAFIVMIRDPLPVDSQINIFPAQASRDGRTSMNYNGHFTASRLIGANDPRLSSVNLDMSEVTAGIQVRGDDGFPLGDQNRELSSSEAEAVVLSAGFIARDHPGYDPRVFCIVGTDGVTSDIGCVTLNFIGYNDDPPVISYTSRGVATFVEGGTDYIRLIDGSFNITDSDHPSYLQMSVSAQIVGFAEGSLEFLRLSSTPSGFTVTYDETSGNLTIAGEATPKDYEQILQDLTYWNNMSEPIGVSRDVDVTVFDGLQRSQPARVRVNINNTNDAPVVSLNGSDPVSTSLGVEYTEGSQPLRVVPCLQVIDVDPDAMIQRAVVNVTNTLNPGQEVLSVSLSVPGLTTSTTDGSVLRLEGQQPLSDYAAVLRTLTYQHLDSNPGNPDTSQIRTITFYVEDTAGASNQPSSSLFLTILPVNDPPVLLIVTNDAIRDAAGVPTSDRLTSQEFNYTEDDPVQNIGQDIYLRDVDGNVASVAIEISNLLDGPQDVVSLSRTLLYWYNVNQTTYSTSTSPESRTISLTGEATSSQYEQILRSLTYSNAFTNNSVSNGTRRLTISANDTQGAASNSISIIVNVSFRNDGPLLDVGAGPNMDHMLTFMEDGFSVPIALQHVLSLGDEEDNNITRVTIRLEAVNGNLDPTDTLFPRTPIASLFLDNLLQPLTGVLIDISFNDSVSSDLYEMVIESVYYANEAEEPTLYNTTGSPLVRIITISVYDSRFDSQLVDADGRVSMGVTNITIEVNIEPINDNAPRIVLRAEPGCASTVAGMSSQSSGGVASQRARRSTSWALASSRRRRRVVETPDDSKAPKLLSAIASFTDDDCLHLVTFSFNSPTNGPVVATKRSVSRIMTFDNPEVNSAIKFGVWLDYTRLVVVFGGCVSRKTVKGMKNRGVKVHLEAERDSCDWTSDCSDHVICFKNLTGCPVSGPHLITIETPCSSGSGCVQNGTGATPPDTSHSKSEIILVVVVILAAALIAIVFFSVRFHCYFRSRSAKPSTMDLDFRDSTVVPIPYSSGPQSSSNEVGIEEVRVVDSIFQTHRKGQETPKNSSSSTSSKPSNHKKERRKFKREKKKEKKVDERQGSTVPILQGDSSSDEEEVVTIYPEASPQSRLQGDHKQRQEELLPHCNEGRNDEEEDSTSSKSFPGESSDTNRSPRISSSSTTASAERPSCSDGPKSIEVQWQDSQT